MSWTKILKPISQTWNVVSAKYTAYDQSNITYDQSNIFYDGFNANSWSKVAKTITNNWTKVAKPI